MDVVIINKINEKLIVYQKQNKLTKTDIANQLNISRQRLSNILKADNLQVIVLVKIALLLNCKLDDLIEYY